MRKIDKMCSLSTVYKTWEESLEKNKSPHPKYNSSNGKYYQDIRMQLYHCQDGLCAYTEIRLCDESIYAAHHWKDGVYTLENTINDVRGQLEHFDESLKAKKKDIKGRKDWLWSNLFMVDSDVNTKIKRREPVDIILKPDATDYKPFELLEYDEELHNFLPHRNLDKSTATKVKIMINTLGLNSIRRLRQSYLAPKLSQIYLNQRDWEDFEVDQFPTAFEMCKRNLENKDFTLDDIL